MLGKILIGGVTLATVGYGIKVYCEEEGCHFFDENVSDEGQGGEEPNTSFPEDSYMNYFYYKVSLYESTMAEFQSLYSQLRNCPMATFQSSITFEPEEVAEDSKDAKKITKRMKKYTKLLNEADHLLRDMLDRLKNIIEVNPHYSVLTKNEQTDIQAAHKLANVIVLLCHEKIIGEDGSVTKHSKELLKSQRAIVDSISSK